jgi:hypothetical protein
MISILSSRRENTIATVVIITPCYKTVITEWH